MLGTTGSITDAIERIREDMRSAEQRHQRLREEFDEFRRRDALNSTALQNRQLDRRNGEEQ